MVVTGQKRNRVGFVIRVVAGVVGLVVFLIWCVSIISNVARLRGEVAERVHWMQSVHRVEQSLHDPNPGTRRGALAALDAELPRIMAAARDDEVLSAAVERATANLRVLERPGGWEAESTEGIASLVPALRRQTALRSVELGSYWDALYMLVGVSIVFSVATLALYIRAHTQNTRQTEYEAARLQAQLLRSDRLAALGTLAATVAHEINNPLCFVLSNLEVLEDRIPDTTADPEVRRSLEEAREGVDRVATIVRDLRSMTHPGPGPERRRVDVNSSLDAALRICEGEARNRATIVREFGRSLPRVFADEAQLGQVFLNLLVNAIQAIEPGDPTSNKIIVRSKRSGDAVEIEVNDTGPGIDAKHIDRLFEPFVTTKDVGEGTGLGLYVCRSIVESLDGTIHLTPLQRGGTRARVTLPVAPATEELGGGSVPIHEPTPTEDQSLRILIVDDEEMLASALARSLKGHTVHTANRGEAAIELAVATRFDLVLCDLIMPEMSGKDVFEALNELDPTIQRRFVFMTGATVTSEARAFAERVEAPVLEKPFSRAELLNVLERFL